MYDMLGGKGLSSVLSEYLYIHWHEGINSVTIYLSLIKILI